MANKFFNRVKKIIEFFSIIIYVIGECKSSINSGIKCKIGGSTEKAHFSRIKENKKVWIIYE